MTVKRMIYCFLPVSPYRCAVSVNLRCSMLRTSEKVHRRMPALPRSSMRTLKAIKSNNSFRVGLRALNSAVRFESRCGILHPSLPTVYWRGSWPRLLACILGWQLCHASDLCSQRFAPFRIMARLHYMIPLWTF